VSCGAAPAKAPPQKKATARGRPASGGGRSTQQPSTSSQSVRPPASCCCTACEATSFSRLVKPCGVVLLLGTGGGEDSFGDCPSGDRLARSWMHADLRRSRRIPALPMQYVLRYTRHHSGVAAATVHVLLCAHAAVSMQSRHNQQKKVHAHLASMMKRCYAHAAWQHM
jgi:hypothetical protein